MASPYADKCERLRARAEAYREAADHLEMDWTEDPIERAEGRKLTAQFRRTWAQLLDQAEDLKA